MLAIALYQPDRAETHPGVSAYVRNVLMTKDANGVAYNPHPSLAIVGVDVETTYLTDEDGAFLLDEDGAYIIDEGPVAAELTGPPRGGLAVVTRAGAHKVFFGTETTVDELDASFQWATVDSGFALPTGDKWGRVQYRDVALWDNVTDGMYAYDIETPAGLTAVPTAPKGKHLGTAFDCVFVLQADGNTHTWQSSAPLDYTNYATSGSRFYIMSDGGELMGVGELSNGVALVFLRQAINILTRTGDRTIYRRDRLSDEIGSTSPDGIVTVNGVSYFPSDTGLWTASAQGLVNIGASKVNRTFIDTLVGDLSLTEGTYDPTRNRILWRFHPKGGSETVFDQLIAFDIGLGEFSGLVDEQTSALLSVGTPGYNADNAGALGNTDTVPYGPDSRFWLGGDRRVFALDENYRAGWFDGANLAATMDTASQMDGKSVRITGAQPLTDAVNMTVSVGYRQRLQDTPTWGDAVGIDEDGFAPVDEAGKVISARLAIPAGEEWKFVRGIEAIEANQRGPR